MQLDPSVRACAPRTLEPPVCHSPSNNFACAAKGRYTPKGASTTQKVATRRAARAARRDLARHEARRERDLLGRRLGRELVELVAAGRQLRERVLELARAARAVVVLVDGLEQRRERLGISPEEPRRFRYKRLQKN